MICMYNVTDVHILLIDELGPLLISDLWRNRKKRNKWSQYNVGCVIWDVHILLLLINWVVDFINLVFLRDNKAYVDLFYETCFHLIMFKFRYEDDDDDDDGDDDDDHDDDDDDDDDDEDDDDDDDNDDDDVVWNQKQFAVVIQQKEGNMNNWQIQYLFEIRNNRYTQYIIWQKIATLD